MTQETAQYDVVVIGSGSGATIVDSALAAGLRAAMIDKDPVGGTCMNVGCIPSKQVIVSADRVMEIREAQRYGVRAQVQDIDFRSIMIHARESRAEGQRHILEGIAQAKDVLGYYPVQAHFLDDHTLQAGDVRVRGERIFVVAGARTHVPPVVGIEQIDYLDNVSVFDLTERPRSLVIVGGGYIGCEFAHFFEAMGTRVTLIQRNARLVPQEEPEISRVLKDSLARRMAVHTGQEVVEVQPTRRGLVAVARDVTTGAEHRVEAERLLLAAGRQSNADLLRVQNAGIATDARGYITTDAYLRTSVPHIWAAGDVLGREMYKHVANREVLYAWHNSQATWRGGAGGGEPIAMDYRVTPHAIFSWPQLAAVGMTEEEARSEHDVLVGYARYGDVARGDALREQEGFAKVIADADSGEVLGFHIIGPEASTLIQEVVDWMALGIGVDSAGIPMRAHPAMPELVAAAVAGLHRHHHHH